MDNQIVELWQKTLNLLKVELTDVSFNTWIKSIEPIIIRDDCIYFCVPNDFTKGILESRYTSLISNCIKQVSTKNYSIKFILPNEAKNI